MSLVKSYTENDFLEWVSSQDVTCRNGLPSLDSFIKRVDFQRVTSGLKASEIHKLFKLAADLPNYVKSYRDKNFLIGYYAGPGLACTGHLGRNFLMALMVGSAVKQAGRYYAEEPNVVELGMGPGLTCIASLLIEPRCRVTAFETDPHCLELGRWLMEKYGLVDRVNIRDEDFLTADLCDLNPDVVINENLIDNLVGEPQFLASNAIQPYTKPTTLFVPGGIDIFLEGKDFKPQPYYEYRRRVKFSDPIPSPLVIERKLRPVKSLPECIFIIYQTAILDNSGGTVQHPCDCSKMWDIDPNTGELVSAYPDPGREFQLCLNLEEHRGFDTAHYRTMMQHTPGLIFTHATLGIDYADRRVYFRLNR